MDVKLLIANQDVAASDGAVFERLNPTTGEVAASAAAASPIDAIRAADAAAAASHGWSSLGPNARRLLLLKAADSIEHRQKEFVLSMTAETGATTAWGEFNVRLAAAMFREAAAMTTQVTGEVIPSDRPGCLSFSIREPVGTVLGIAPWNAPAILGVRAMALPLACGNTVVLKSSEICPRTHYLLGALLRDVGFPPGAVNVLSTSSKGAGPVVETLISHAAIRRINFTGSTRVGRIVAEMAARHLKPILLELGGKAPLIVLDDADLDQAAHAATFGAFMNQGQICMSTERIVIQENVADAFLRRFVDRAASLTVRNRTDPEANIGSLVGVEAAVRVEELVCDAVSKGANLILGGTRQESVMRPAILDHVSREMRIYHEESFGPVVSILRVGDDEEAVRIANDTEYGLTASVFSQDVARALGIARQIQSGMCHINGPTVHDEAQVPFGGLKASGNGRFGGRAGIDEFTELRWFTINTKAPHYPF